MDVANIQLLHLIQRNS